MVASTVVLALASLIGASAASLTKCPSTETQVTTSDGSIYAVCKNTDYQGETTFLNVNVASPLACATLCNQKSGCQQAVYDAGNKVCHLKGPASGLDWEPSNQYTTIRFVAKPAQGSPVTSCPTTEQVVNTNGVSFAVCSNTDYQGETVTAVPNINSPAACASACSVIPTCNNAVYDPQSSQCYIKNPNGAQLAWTYNLRYTSLRVTAQTAQGSTLNACPQGSSASFSTSKGTPFTSCTNGDFGVNSIDILGSVASAKACAEICAPRTDCSFASYDSIQKACHIKPTNPAPRCVFNRGFVSLKKGNTPRRI